MMTLTLLEKRKNNLKKYDVKNEKKTWSGILNGKELRTPWAAACSRVLDNIYEELLYWNIGFLEPIDFSRSPKFF